MHHSFLFSGINRHVRLNYLKKKKKNHQLITIRTKTYNYAEIDVHFKHTSHLFLKSNQNICNFNVPHSDIF